MTATEYFDKYKPLFFASDITIEKAEDTVRGLFFDMMDEVLRARLSNGINTYSGLLDLIFEQNEIWNELACLFAIKYLMVPIKPDGFLELRVKYFPSLRNLL